MATLEKPRGFDFAKPASWLSSGLPEAAAAPPADTSQDQRFRAEYAAHRATHLHAGVSEEQYVRSRRIDEGLEPLVAQQSVK